MKKRTILALAIFAAAVIGTAGYLISATETILALAIFAAAVIGTAGYLISATESCLFQPSITDIPPSNILLQVRHAKQNDECIPDCDHGCGTTTGYIKAEVWKRGELEPEYRYNLEQDGSFTCYTNWSVEITDDISNCNYVKFYHNTEDPAYSGTDCWCTINIE